MRADHRHLLARLVLVLAVLLGVVGSGLSHAPAARAADNPKYHLDYGPSSGKECPVDFTGGGTCGIDKQGNYCDYYSINDDDICRTPEAGEIPGTSQPCEGGPVQSGCSKKESHEAEEEKLKKWRKSAIAAVQRGDLSKSDYDTLNDFLTKCVDKGDTFSDCQTLATDKYGNIGWSLSKWIGKKVSQLARDALEEAAQYIGNAVVWLLQQFADLFAKTSVINLDSTGISQPMGIATALSIVLAVFLLLLQFGKVSISHQGAPAATAISGLAKWAVISSAYWTVTTTALQVADSLSNWIISYSFAGGSKIQGQPADAMKAQFGKMFGGLIFGGGGSSTAAGALITGDGMAASAVGVVIVIGIICILAIGALWVEMLLRQAGIMILVATMPITLVGQMSDATKDWWPKARDALLALILMKPMITFCFAIGFFAIEQGSGVQNMLVGLVIFLMACFCWPAIAKFMTFSSLGAGAAMAGGLISSLGSSAASTSGYRPQPGGAGAVGGGPAYTRALERDNAQTQASGANAQGGGGFWTNESLKARLKGPGGRLGTRVAGPLGLGLQVMALGKDTLESGMANTAAHAGLDSASPGGRHVVIPPRGQDTAGLPPATQERAPQPRPDTAPVITGPPNTDIPPSREG
ncbi:hypothetical protein [Streptomyces sp. MUSC 125]|uniref:hypothetical protein n=1 Tax=Streptomyces sp. MUSC 125 TaxID=1428624 RepID=UPI00068A6A39|nr:hypothetical protein [Streptomyces sp. MUSC 125]